jgi:hypothetical protein
VSSRPVVGPTQPHIQQVPVSLSVGVKLPKREADHLPPTSPDVKTTWFYTAALPYAFMA